MTRSPGGVRPGGHGGAATYRFTSVGLSGTRRAYCEDHVRPESLVMNVCSDVLQSDLYSLQELASITAEAVVAVERPTVRTPLGSPVVWIRLQVFPELVEAKRAPAKIQTCPAIAAVATSPALS